MSYYNCVSPQFKNWKTLLWSEVLNLKLPFRSIPPPLPLSPMSVCLRFSKSWTIFVRRVNPRNRRQAQCRNAEVYGRTDFYFAECTVFETVEQFLFTCLRSWILNSVLSRVRLGEYKLNRINRFRVHEESYMYIYRISYLYYIVIGFASTALVTLVASRFFKSDVDNLDPKLFVSVVSQRLERKLKATRKKYSTTSKTVTFACDS